MFNGGTKAPRFSSVTSPTRRRCEGWLPAVKHCDRRCGEVRGEGGERCERRLIGAVILGEDERG